MKHSLLLKTFLLIICLGLGACSNRWREGDIELDGAQLNAEVRAALSQESGLRAQGLSQQADRFSRLFEASGSQVFVAANMGGSVEAKTPIYDWSFISPDITLTSIRTVNAYLVEAETESGVEVALMFDLTLQDNRRVTRTFFSDRQSPGEIVMGEGFFSADLNGSSATIRVKSIDVDADGYLNDVIQLEIYQTSGGEAFVGLIASMIAFR